MKRTWELWLQRDDPDIEIKFIDTAIRAVVLNKALEFAPDNQSVLVIGLDGNCYVEDGLRAVTDYHELKLGNAYELGFDEVFRLSDKYVANAFAVPQECEQCDFVNLCRGGEYTHRRASLHSRVPKKSFLCSSLYLSFENAREFASRLGIVDSVQKQIHQ